MNAAARWAQLGIVMAMCLPGLRAAEPPAKPSATLRWNNGESLSGEIVEGSATDLTWKSAIFDDPLVLSWHALSRIDQTSPPITTTDSFSIVLRNGSHLYGDLV